VLSVGRVWRIARGDEGRPHGEFGGKEAIVGVGLVDFGAGDSFMRETDDEIRSCAEVRRSAD